MRHVIGIFVFTILTTMFYYYVGQMVPQKETYPPEELTISKDLTTDQMVEIGEQIVGGKGTCLTCHTIGESGAHRFPDLGGIGNTAASRVQGQSAVEYLAESIYDPNAYIVDGYVAGMPAMHRAPTNLNDDEILTIIAYLQSLGGTPDVTMSSSHSFTGQNPAAAAGAAPVAAAPSMSENLDGAGLYEKYLCNTCHSVDTDAPLIGPSLYDAGNRMSTADIYESIVDPDAKLADGYPGGVMIATLNGMNFYDSVSPKDLKKLVDYIASKKGN